MTATATASASAYWTAYATVESAHPAAWAPYAHYDAPRPLVTSLVPVATRRELGRLARAVERAAVAGGDSETAAAWSARADEWERSIAPAWEPVGNGSLALTHDGVSRGDRPPTVAPPAGFALAQTLWLDGAWRTWASPDAPPPVLAHVEAPPRTEGGYVLPCGCRGHSPDRCPLCSTTEHSWTR